MRHTTIILGTVLFLGLAGVGSRLEAGPTTVTFPRNTTSDSSSSLNEAINRSFAEKRERRASTFFFAIVAGVILGVIRILIAIATSLAPTTRPRRSARLRDEEVPEWVRQQE